MDPPIVRSEDLDFAAFVRPGDVVVCGQGTAEPLTLTRRLVARKDDIGPFTCWLGVGLSDTFAPERSARHRLPGLRGDRDQRRPVARGAARRPALALFSPGTRLRDGRPARRRRPAPARPTAARPVRLQPRPGERLRRGGGPARPAWSWPRSTRTCPGPTGAPCPPRSGPTSSSAADAPPQELRPSRFGDVETRIARHRRGARARGGLPAVRRGCGSRRGHVGAAATTGRSRSIPA